MISFLHREPNLVNNNTSTISTSDIEPGCLRTSNSHVYIHHKLQQTIEVWWNVGKQSNENLLDWIGLFNCDDTTSCYLDQKSIRRLTSPTTFRLSQKNVLNLKRLYFGYIDGMTGKMLAKSSIVYICYEACFVVQEVNIHDDSGKSQEEKPNKIWLKINNNQQLIWSSSQESFKQTKFYIPKSVKGMENVQITIQFGLFKCRQFIVDIELDTNCSKCSFREYFDYNIEILYSIEPILEKDIQVDVSSMESSSSSDLSSSAMKQRSIVKSPWQTCLDAKGRVFYVNHETEETSWINPEKNLPRQQRRKRRDSISQVHRGEFVSVTPRRTIAHNDSMIENSDAISEFLQRDDFIIKLHDNEKAMSLYNSSAIVRHALHRIQHRVDSPHRYQSSGEFVEFVNAFADRTEPLPLGWEMKSIDGKRVFLSHSHRVTTLFDPRVRLLESRQRRGRSAPPKRGSAIDSVDKNGNHVLVNKYDEIMHVAQEKLPHIAGRIRKKLRLIDRFGELAIASLANDLDLSLAVSMLDDNEEKNDAGEPTSDQRITEFYAQLYRAKYSRGPLKITWNISRENLVQDAHSHILEADINLLKRARIHIVFDDEIGLDYGGPSREFFLLLSRQLFNPSNGYFDYHGNDYQLQLCRRHQIRTEDIRWLRLCARILALSIIHKCLIDVFFTQVFYKHLLKMKIHIDDFEQCDPQFYNSMKWILENDVSELDMKFIYTDVEITGKTCDFNLLPSGDSITVTNENKHDFVNLMCQAQSKKGIEEQLTIITTEFHQILSLDLIGQLSPSELSMTLSGSMELDLFDWRSNTIYKGGYFDSHVVIEWFWDCVEQMTNEQRFNLLLFATGTSTVPFDGFASLRGTNGSNRFCIEKWGEETSLPRAHTCFNRLQLPSYQTKKIMKDKIMQAITNGLSYSIE